MSWGWFCPKCKAVGPETPCPTCGREELYHRPIRTAPLSARQRIILRELEKGGVMERGTRHMFWLYCIDSRKIRAFRAAWDLIDAGYIHPTSYRITAKGREILERRKS